MSVKSDIQEHPLLYLFLTCLCTAIAVFGTTTFATMNYVDKGDARVRQYAKEKAADTNKLLTDIKKEMKTLPTKVVCGNCEKEEGQEKYLACSKW